MYPLAKEDWSLHRFVLKLLILPFVLFFIPLCNFDFGCCTLYAAEELSNNDALSHNFKISTFDENIRHNDNNDHNRNSLVFYIIRTDADSADIALPTKTETPSQDQKSSLVRASIPPITFLTGSSSDNDSSATTTNSTTKDPARATDSDGDGLTDIQEIDTFRTSINDSDSDIDGLPDGKEVKGWSWFAEEQRGCFNTTLTNTCQIHKTNPLSSDTDGDRNSDYYEYNTFGSNPTDPDQDKDGLSDGIESGPNGLYDTSFFTADTDKDGLSDGLEIQTGRDPTKPDNPGRDRGKAEEPGVNDAPIANPQRVVTVRNDPVDITLTGSDKESETLYFFLAAHPLHGSLSTLMVTGSASAKLTYTPLPNYAGEDRFTFWAYDGKAYSSSPGRVTIYISP
jgi:hypothetical protein